MSLKDELREYQCCKKKDSQNMKGQVSLSHHFNRYGEVRDILSKLSPSRLCMTLCTKQYNLCHTQLDTVCVCVFPCRRQLFFVVMQGCNMCRWCYFSSRFILEVKSSAAVVTLVRVAWHIIKWPTAHSLGVLTLNSVSLS